MDRESIEGIAGFQDWIVPSSHWIRPGKTPGGVVIGVAPLQCSFNRELSAEESARVRDVLTEHVRRATSFVVRVDFGARLGEIAGADLERLRSIVGEARFNRLSTYDASFDLVFAGDRDAAEEKIVELRASGTMAELEVRMAPNLDRELEHWQRSWLVKAGRIEELMRPGALSVRGFLGGTERLADVIAKDAATLARLGVNEAKISDRLRTLLQPVIESDSGDGDAQSVDNFEIKLTQWRGFQECPWGCPDDPTWSSFDFDIRNTRTDKMLQGPALIVHLISAHSFFEGTETPYRVDPENAVQVLELAPSLTAM